MLRLLSLALVSLAPSLGAQQLWTVDDDGPADFADLQAAVNAAADGDTLLVRAGAYQRIQILGKGLVLQGQGQPVIQAILFPGPAIDIRGLTADQAVHVRGFTTQSLGFGEQENVFLWANEGSLLFEDCLLQTGGGESVVVRDSASVTFVNSELHAAPTFASFAGQLFLAHVPYTGLSATNSNVFLYDCDVRGSAGTDSDAFLFWDLPPGPGGPGVGLLDSTLLASGTTIRGGSGGSSIVDCYPGATGATGLLVSEGGSPITSVARLLDTTVTGGTGGTGDCGLADAPDAPDQVGAPGSIVDLGAGPARSFTPASPVAAGGTIELQFEGEPGDRLLVHMSLGVQPGILIEPLGLALHVDWPYAVLDFGSLPASGVLQESFPLPALAGGDHIVFVGQCLFVGATGLFDGGPRTVTLLGPGI